VSAGAETPAAEQDREPMPLRCGHLGDGSGWIEASAEQQPLAAGERDVGSVAGRR
jgi:hypothetical protein